VQVASRPYVMAGVVLAAASAVAVTPLAPRPAELPIVSMPTRLVDAGSILNIPFNLFQDIVNIPYNEVQALDFSGQSLLNTGPWFVVGSTNLWGVDPGDPSHFESVINSLLPFPALSGMGSPETDFTAGLGQQLWGAVAAELPVNAACDAASCLPIAPTSPITDVTGADTLIWLEQILTGQQQFPLIDNWFQVPLSSLLNGYTFSPGAPGSVDPSGPAYQLFPNIAGTGAGNAMPWSGETYTLQPWVPFENFFNSLMATPNLSGFEFPTFTELAQAVQTFLAGAVMNFDPFIPGSPFCFGACSNITDSGLNYPQLIQDISNVMPGNPSIDAWLTAYANGTANVPTAEQIQNSINILQQGFFDGGNPAPPGTSIGSDLSPYFTELWQSLGINPAAIPGGLAAVLGLATYAPSNTPAADSFDPTTLSADLSTLLAGLDPTALSADLSTLLANFAATLAPELGTTLPAALLSSF
jgi:hypothetical protein